MSRTYLIGLQDTPYHYKDAEVISRTECKINCCYDPNYKGYTCATQGPPCKTVFITDDETMIQSAQIIDKQTLKVIVGYIPCPNSKPDNVAVHLLRL